MRKLSANLIFTAVGRVLKNGILILDDFGKITEIIDANGKIHQSADIEYFDGVLVPGFVNAHCHLELSHTKAVIPQITGLTEFIRQINLTRNLPADKAQAMAAAHTEMRRNGIVAVGDISNTTDSFQIKKTNSEIRYHTFVELFKLSQLTEKEIISYAETLIFELKNRELRGSIVPHASYSVTPELFAEIAKSNPDNAVISMHNQETEDENALFLNQTGELKTYLESRGFDYSNFIFLGKNALQTCLPMLNPKNNILLIHNTLTDNEDIEFAENFSENIFWTFCPSSNLYIENTLPNIPLFFEKGVKTCLGTDGYSSNIALSVFQEMQAIQNRFPQISFEKLLESATINGARALKFDRELGSFEIGKSPGVNLITNFDFENNRITNLSQVVVL